MVHSSTLFIIIKANKTDSLHYTDIHRIQSMIFMQFIMEWILLPWVQSLPNHLGIQLQSQTKLPSHPSLQGYLLHPIQLRSSSQLHLETVPDYFLIRYACPMLHSRPVRLQNRCHLVKGLKAIHPSLVQ